MDFVVPMGKIMPSDGSGRDAVLLAVERWYHFHESGCHLGTLGSMPFSLRFVKHVLAGIGYGLGGIFNNKQPI